MIGLNVIHIRNLIKKTLNHGLFLKKLHGVIKSNENPWQKPYVDTNTDLRKETKADFEKSFLRWWIRKLSEKLWKM